MVGASTSTSRPERALRLGLVLPSPLAPQWTADLVDSLLANDRAYVRVAVCPFYVAPATSQSATCRLFSALTVVNRVLTRGSPDAFVPVAITRILRGVPSIAKPRQGLYEAANGSSPLDTETIEALRPLRLDVIIWLTVGEAPARLSEMARYGVWSIPGALHATYSDGIHLARHLDPEGELAYVGLYTRAGRARPPVEQAVVGTPWASWDRVREEVVRRACALVQRRLVAVHALAELGLMPTTVNASAHEGDRADGRPGNGGRKAIVLLARKAKTTVVRRADRRLHRRQEWFAAFGVSRPDDEPLKLPAELTPILPPPGHEYADPFVVRWKGRTYLFVEDISHGSDKATISMLEFGGAGPIGPPRAILDVPFHLSYPYVFQVDGKLYLMPESRQAGSIDLYSPSDDLAHWDHVARIMTNVQAADSTVVTWHEKLWLFCAMPAPGTRAACEELHLFFSSSLTTGWTPHPLNPVVSDIRRARPAGTPFLRNGQLIRPAQDCSRRYGGSIVFNQVEILDEKRYCERPVSRIGPGWAPGVTATHTYNRVDEITVVDGKWWWRPALRRRAAGVELAG
jgi:hypothetical protein